MQKFVPVSPPAKSLHLVLPKGDCVHLIDVTPK